MSLNIPEEPTQASPSSLVSWLISRVSDSFLYKLSSNGFLTQGLLSPSLERNQKEGKSTMLGA